MPSVCHEGPREHRPAGGFGVVSRQQPFSRRRVVGMLVCSHLLSRSARMKSIFLLAVVTLGLSFVCGPNLAADEQKVKPLQVLLVCGGCCHDYDHQKVLLAKGLEERAHVQVTMVQQGGTVTTSKIPLYEKENWSEGFDVVIHDECFSDAKEPDWTARILNPHKAGLPAVLLHCAMHCYRDGTDEWFKFCGVTSRRHGANYAHDVINRDARHPIMENFGTAWTNPAGE